MSNVERGLWRIAELGARCSQQSAAGSRGPLWAELEETIARLDAEFEAARQAVDIAPAQVRSLEGRLSVARKERDREKARAEEHLADAAAARRERDRMRAKAEKAAAAATEARAAAGQAEKAAADAVAKATAAQAALDQAHKARTELAARLDEMVAARDRVMGALDTAEECIATLETRIRGLQTELEATRTERDTLKAAAEVAQAERADALDTLAARAEGAVVVLPGVALPDAEAGPVAPPARVAWHPTWSEWADDEADGDVAAEPAVAVTPVSRPAEAVEPVAAAPAEVDLGVDVDIDVDDTSLFEPHDEGAVRYLNVAATIGQLLPDDLGPLLLAGTTVLRREGRLFATVAVASDPWAPPGAAGETQAEKLAAAGFRVEWTTDAPLAC
ncbi:MAG TPA: hypothetical protein VFE55_21160 [Acidimicrobiia bacterium]|nr:hypothetical protein [Acidimicrobiia bacterium]